jgi:hypothetical protein
MPIQGTGGLPSRRADQITSYQPPTQAPGASAGVTRTRIVEIIGGSGSGIYVYSGAPASGSLIASLVGATTTDPFGNPVQANGLTVYGANGQSVFLGVAGTLGELIFYSGASFEGTAANVSAAPFGSGSGAVMELLFSGPKGNAGAGTDWVQIEMISAEAGGLSEGAEGYLNWIDSSGGVHALLQWGVNGISAGLTGSTINAINPGQFTMAFAQTAGAPPSSGGTVAGSFGGAALSYLTALQSVVNANAAALDDIVNGLDGWGV